MVKHKILVIGILGLLVTASVAVAAGNKSSEDTVVISVEKVLRDYRKNSLVIIDVRNAEAFAKLRIPGALNIPLYAVKTKAFLKSGPIVLINEGFNLSPLETECRALREKGFKASALQGGLIAWDAGKGPLEGDRHHLAEARLVSANMYHQEKERSDLILIDASTPEPLKPIHKNNLRPVLVFTHNGTGYDNIQYELEKAEVGPVFFLDGGLSGYKAFRNNLALSLRSREERTQSIGACPSCKQKKEEQTK